MATEFLFGLSFLTSTFALPEQSCNRIKFGDNWYEREIMWSHVGRPFNLNIHKTSNILFFSYSDSDSFSDVDFQLASLYIDTGDYQTIAGIRGGCAVTVDQLYDEVYLGGSDGIYKYNMMTKLADIYKEKGKNIWSLFYRNNLFYVSYPDQRLFIEIDGKFSRVKEFENFEVDHFYVTYDKQYFFANKSGLFKYDNVNMKTVVVHEMLTVREITEDNEGQLYIVTNFGIYANINSDVLTKVIDLKNIYGLAFDRDNIVILSDEKNIFRLVYSSTNCLDTVNSW